MRTARVLVVDDDAMPLFGVRDLLERDFEVVEAENGRVALSRFGEQTVDVVVTDVIMPEMDGVELTRAIRARGRTRVIWCTAYDREEFRREAKALAVDAYLLKPLDLDVLYRTVTAPAEGAS